jgi:hypothetical protein
MKGCDCQGVGHTPWCKVPEVEMLREMNGAHAEGHAEALRMYDDATADRDRLAQRCAELEAERALLRERFDAEVARHEATARAVNESYERGRAVGLNVGCAQMESLAIQRDAALATAEKMRGVTTAAAEWRAANIEDRRLCETSGWTKESRKRIGRARLALEAAIDAAGKGEL